MKLKDFTYNLPKTKIAQHPVKKRGNAKLLVVNRADGGIKDQKYTDILEYLNPGDVLVLNNTKVIKARLMTMGSDGRQHEILLTEKHGQVEDSFHHKVIYRGGLLAGMDLSIGNVSLRVVGVYDHGTALVASPVDFMELTEKFGHVPLPPYMKRQDTAEDRKRYQTEFAKNIGSVAAPTASLNMTRELIEKIKAKGVNVCYLTLHVGLGTFLPIRVDDIKKHVMHSEWFDIPGETSRAVGSAKKTKNKVVAVGTTVARTLEFASQELGAGRPVSGEADIFIYPEYKFRVVDGLLTNFHAPRSTVLMLAAAFVGWGSLHGAYLHALKSDYRFLSYGDSMLII